MEWMINENCRHNPTAVHTQANVHLLWGRVLDCRAISLRPQRRETESLVRIWPSDSAMNLTLTWTSLTQSVSFLLYQCCHHTQTHKRQNGIKSPINTACCRCHQPPPHQWMTTLASRISVRNSKGQGNPKLRRMMITPSCWMWEANL